MKRLIIVIFMLAACSANAQTWHCQVSDATTGKALPYAIINLLPLQTVLYSDSTGGFDVDFNLIPVTDSIKIEYIGFETLILSIKNVEDQYIFLLTPLGTVLPEVTVTTCTKYKEITINKNAGKVIEYIGPGAETKIIILAHYATKFSWEGWLTQIDMYAGNFEKPFNVPVRIHWYVWDTIKKFIGEELTSSNIIIYPRNRGWSHFAIPAHAIYFPPEGLVVGLEFIYPIEYEKALTALTDETEKANLLNDKSRRWSLGMQLTEDENDRAWFIYNNKAIHPYPAYSNELFLKPAIRITMSACARK